MDHCESPYYNTIDRAQDTYVKVIVRGLPRTVELDAKMVKLSILNSLRNLYGIYGSGKYDFSILHLSKRTVILHTELENAVALRSAITFTTSIQRQECKLDVEKTSTCLMGLAP